MSLLNVSTDQTGQVVGLSHHDGSLSGIEFLAEKAIRLSLVDSRGLDRLVVLQNCSYFAANNLREGNIVDRMYVWPVANAPVTALKRAQTLFNLEPKLVSKLISDGKMLFVLESSYGTDICAVVEQVRCAG